MPDPQTSILLRKGPHDGTPSNATTRVRYALQCDNFSIQIAKTPIQVPNALNSPILIDIGFQRPSISINGTIANGGDGTSSYSGYFGMPSFEFTRDIEGTSTSATCRYYFPYKNVLETAATTWVYTDNNQLEIEIGNIETPTGHVSATGGGLYQVAIQQCRFQIDASKEDRWTFAMQFVAKSREDIVF
jgi:hypothetical protein